MNAQSSRSIVRRIYGGLGFVVGGKAGAGLISLAYMAIATRMLGPNDYGVLVLLHGFVMTVCGIVAFPAWQGILRYGTHAMAQDDGHRLVRLLRFGALLELSAGALAIAAIIVLAPVFGPRLGWSSDVQHFATLYAFAALGSVRSTPAAYLQLINRFDLVGAHNLVAPLVRLAGATLVLLLGGGLLGFIIAWLIAAIAEWASLWALGYYFALRDLGKILHKPEEGNVRAENVGIWRFMFASNADVTLAELTGRIAPLMVGWFLSPTAAGLFAVAQRATVIIAQPAQILGNSSYAELSRLVAGRQGGHMLRKTLLKVIAIALAAAVPVFALLAIFSQPLIELMAGPAFSSARGVMLWLVCARIIALIGPPCSSALSALGKPGLSVMSNLGSSLLFLPLLPLMMAEWGLTGAGYQAVCQALLSSVLLAVLIWRYSAMLDEKA